MDEILGAIKLVLLLLICFICCKGYSYSKSFYWLWLLVGLGLSPIIYVMLQTYCEAARINMGLNESSYGAILVLLLIIESMFIVFGLRSLLLSEKKKQTTGKSKGGNK